ncbi:hypothetical protein [Wenzhouxiangella sp. EGI_FJ10305]|uniref:hypothetical protein n=1 Tax=Wenzhouxiangella sp. EGI_FJ10305 TaxID=3243768 RepID=UPI0035DA7897
MNKAGLIAGLVIVYILLLLPLMIWPDYIDTPLGLIAVLPMFAVHVLDRAGVPGLLSTSSCSWGWCEPSTLGWAVMLLVAAVMIVFLAVALSALRRKP